MTYREDQELEVAMGQMLRIGVTSAATIVLAGGILYLKHFHSLTPDYSRFHGASLASRSVRAILAGANSFDSESLISFGILVLIATPVCRVIFGVIGFALQRDRIYTVVSAIVLIVLLMSFFVRR